MKTYETRKQVSDRTGICERTFANWAATGDGPPFLKIGRRVLYESAVVDAWLAQHRVTSTSDASARQVAA